MLGLCPHQFEQDGQTSIDVILELKRPHLTRVHKSKAEDGRERLPIKSEYLLINFARKEELPQDLDQGKIIKKDYDDDNEQANASS